MYSVYLSEVPVSQVRMNTLRNDSSQGRITNSGDFFLFDPYIHALVDAETACDCSIMYCIYAADFPVVFVLVSDAGVTRRI